MKIYFYCRRFAILSYLSGRWLSILCGVELLPQAANELKKAVLGSFVFYHFCILSSQFLKTKLWLAITPFEVLTFSNFQNLPFLTIFERLVFFRALRASICFAFSVK
jgi:hypothetical protein